MRGRRLKVPASLANIDLDRVRRVMFRSDGNITRAAKSLKVRSADLRRLTWRHPALIMDALEEAHRMVDRAERKLSEALDGDHKDRALAAACFILKHSQAARERGWSRHGGPYRDPYDAPSAAAPTVVIWAGDSPGYRPTAASIPEARLADASSSTDLATDADRIH